MCFAAKMDKKDDIKEDKYTESTLRYVQRMVTDVQELESLVKKVKCRGEGLLKCLSCGLQAVEVESQEEIAR